MIFDVFLAGFTKEMPPMALNESDLSELLDALRAGGNIDVIDLVRALGLEAGNLLPGSSTGLRPSGW